MMTYYPELPYSFIIVTLLGTATVSFPATQWDRPERPEVAGPGAPILHSYIEECGIGFHGHLFTLEAVSPQDLHHALTMNDTTHHRPSVGSFTVIGYVPAENLSDEDAVEDDDDAGDED